MSVIVKEIEIYNSTDGICKELPVNSGSAITITTYGNGSCELEVSTDSGLTYFPRFAVNMKTCNANYRLTDEGMFYTICGDCDRVRVNNVIGFDKIVATIS